MNTPSFPILRRDARKLVTASAWKEIQDGKKVLDKERNHFVYKNGDIYLKEQTAEYRLEVLKRAVGQTEPVARQIIKLHDGNVYRDEINAVMLKLISTSRAYGEGLLTRLEEKRTKNPYCKAIEYSDYINWNCGWETADLAIKLHGKEKVMENA